MGLIVPAEPDKTDIGSPDSDKRLRDAIEWMCTEMPDDWEEIAETEGCSDVVETVAAVVRR